MSGSEISLYIVNGLGQRKKMDQIIRKDTLEEKNQELLEGISHELLREIYSRMSVLDDTLCKVMEDTKTIHGILENSLWVTRAPKALRGAYSTVFQDKPELRKSCIKLHSSISILRGFVLDTIKRIGIASEKFGEENEHE